MILLTKILLFSLFFCATIGQRFYQPQVVCKTPDDGIGTCVTLTNCPALVQLYGRNGGSQDAVRFLLAAKRNCGNRVFRNDPVVCCSETYSESRQSDFDERQNNNFNNENRFQQNPDNPFLPDGNNNQFNPNPNNQFNSDRNNQFNPNRNNQFNPDRNNPLFPDSNDSRQPPSTEPTQKFPFFPPPVEEPSNDERFPPVRSTTQRTTTSTRRTTTSTTTFRPPTTQRPVSTSTIQQTGEECTTPDSRFGICRPLAECTELINRLQANPNDKNFVVFLRESNKICGQYSAVCCPKENRQETAEADFIPPNAKPTLKPISTIEARILKPEEGCGQSNGEYKKIVGGEPANVGAYPWIALLGYGYDDATQFRCGGALITKRHVLTASHCIRGDLKLVRLGEHDIDVDNESNHIDVKVKSFRRHPKYNPNDGHNDIAILYLAEDVRFSDTIRPICVPDVGELNPRDLIGYHPFVAGWGKTIERGNSSNVLLEIQLPILANEDCRKRFAEERAWKSEQQFDDAVICAGFLAGGKDTCQGDSGGPLMLPKQPTGNSDTFYFNLLGIISYGIGCARPGIPGVYASVPHFAKWIREMVADDNGA